MQNIMKWYEALEGNEQAALWGLFAICVIATDYVWRKFRRNRKANQ